jgi:glutaredoxin
VVKEFLHEREIPYTLRDLNTDSAAREEFIRAGYLLPPVTVIDGVAVVGFAPDRLEQLLGAARGKES